jgi:hypothetical protein
MDDRRAAGEGALERLQIEDVGARAIDADDIVVDGQIVGEPRTDEASGAGHGNAWWRLGRHAVIKSISTG